VLLHISFVCREPYWNWGRIIGVTIAAIIGVIFLVLLALLIVYCKKKKTQTGRLHHTVSLRSNNIIYPYSIQPPDYIDIQQSESDVPFALCHVHIVLSDNASQLRLLLHTGSSV